MITSVIAYCTANDGSGRRPSASAPASTGNNDKRVGSVGR